MSAQRQVNVKELVEEAKKRIVILVICVVGLSYLMSLTSSSVWVNLPAAASLIILLRYFSLDYKMRRKAATYTRKPLSTNTLSQNKPIKSTKVVETADWRMKVNSPVVEDAIDHFSRHLVSEWVTGLWYSKLTPDREGPEELVQIMNGVLGEILSRMRNINLIDLLTRDLINLFCNHLESFRFCRSKIERLQSELTVEQRDKGLRSVLAAENKLHPALFSAEAEHKVLQHLMEGLISCTFKQEDLQCSFFRYIVRELLARAVMRPVLNLASPRFINERIEILVISKANKGVAASQEASDSKPNGSSGISNFSKFLDPTGTGIELVQLKSSQSRNGSVTHETSNINGINISKDPLLSMDARSSLSWSSLPLSSQVREEHIWRHHSEGEWGEVLDKMSCRKTAALAPENFENMWRKGRDYRRKEAENWSIEQAPQNSSRSKPLFVDHPKKIPKLKEKDGASKHDPLQAHKSRALSSNHSTVQKTHTDQNMPNNSLLPSYQEDADENIVHQDEAESGSSSSYTSEEEEDPSSVTGLDSPITKVWDGKTNRNQAVSHIHHPLENAEGHIAKKTGRGPAHFRKLPRTQFGRKRSRSSAQTTHVWQEIERTSFFSGDGQDILSSKGHMKAEESSDDSEVENLGRVHSGAAASSSATSNTFPESHSTNVKSLKNSLMMDSFFKLRCEVLGANIVKSGCKTFAVYSISVTDVNNNSWSIKRRFQHFEELHQRLKEYPEYCLHLPPKHFLLTGLDVPVIQERSKLLDSYLKKLLQLPIISRSIEVWDFLSVHSQTYVFSNSFSVIETLSVDLGDKPSEKSKRVSNFTRPVINTLAARREILDTECKESTLHSKHFVAGGVRMNAKDVSQSSARTFGYEHQKSLDDSGGGSDKQKNPLSARNLGKIVKGRETNGLEKTSELLHDATTDPCFPAEWVPPNLTIPILDLVDVIFQLQDGGWIRRKAFWVAKQLLHLGMGDALDDWLIEKIQFLRKGSVIASGIQRVERILWPDGIFITKHPKRRPPPNAKPPFSSPCSQQATDMSSPKFNSPHAQQPTEISSPRLSDEQIQQEAERHAKFVYNLMIENAPAAVVGLVGRKEYEQGAKDLYFFIQSSVCLKQLAFDLLELLLLSAFPEMDYVFRQLQEEKHRFGEFQSN